MTLRFLVLGDGTVSKSQPIHSFRNSSEMNASVVLQLRTTCIHGAMYGIIFVPPEESDGVFFLIASVKSCGWQAFFFLRVSMNVYYRGMAQ